jgi:hypothetical protein
MAPPLSAKNLGVGWCIVSQNLTCHPSAEPTPRASLSPSLPAGETELAKRLAALPREKKDALLVLLGLQRALFRSESSLGRQSDIILDGKITGAPKPLKTHHSCPSTARVRKKSRLPTLHGFGFTTPMPPL